MSDKPVVLLVGVSTRAMCQSAVNAGYEVISLDYFADYDQPPQIKSYSLSKDFHLPLSIPNLITAARGLLPLVQVVVPGAGLENIGDLLAGSPVELWGNEPEASSKVRNQRLLKEILPGTGLELPRTLHLGDEQPGEGRWLKKDLAHNGGVGVKDWHAGMAWRTGEIIQEFIPGQLCSAVFVADGRQARLLGLTRQYAGVKELGAKDYWWCGNAAPLIDMAIFQRLETAASVLTAACGLKGLNGIDFIVRDGIPYLLEVNPRWSGSVELFEKVGAYNAFDLHRWGCEGYLPSQQSIEVRPIYWAKGIVYARRKIEMGYQDDWPLGDYADIPYPGEVILKGSPICSVLSFDITLEQSWEGVLRKVRAMEQKLYLS
ncbi:MAG TPA: ATP-grasp domain-containing protein [Longilinea sp.]|nr:ATP-grasp domain-containing protein [Longilinea sp.]